MLGHLTAPQGVESGLAILFQMLGDGVVGRGHDGISDFLVRISRQNAANVELWLPALGDLAIDKVLFVSG